METILFSFFSILSFICGICVITAKNPIHSVLCLVLVFFNISGLLIILGVEFLALLFLIVYVGAIAVLFLFVVMMLDVKTINMSKDFLKYFPFGSFIGIVFLIETLLIVPSVFEKFNPYTTSFLVNYYVD